MAAYPWTSVDSSWVRAVRLVPGGLEVRVMGGRTYLYRGVSERTYQELLATGSKGRFLNARIKGRYGVSEVY